MIRRKGAKDAKIFSYGFFATFASLRRKEAYSGLEAKWVHRVRRKSEKSEVVMSLFKKARAEAMYG